ncbi:MAG TPA: SDR family oxidoreductase [Thermoanaerobaculia bacterium]|jgi:NAD(P)-dependent dehydrogenase (short-subunit alcohol dehydrogenase family)
MTDSEFSGRVAIVAGGTGALGRAVSLAFLAEGAAVVATYRRKEELDRLTAEAPDASRLEGTMADVTDESGAETLVSGVAARHGRLDVLVNAVGAYAGGAKIWEADPGELGKMLDVNLLPCWALSRAAAPRMVEQKRGAIVHVVSKAAVEHAAGQAAYAASKAAALALTESLAADLRGTGVRANAVLPSVIDTEQNRKAMPKADHSKWPRPEEIARVILFLCSDAARLIHGAAIPVYGNH